MENQVYFDGFNVSTDDERNRDRLCEEFDIQRGDISLARILFASTTESSRDAVVVVSGTLTGSLALVDTATYEGGPRDGFEGLWHPEKTTWSELAAMPYCDLPIEACVALRKLIARNRS